MKRQRTEADSGVRTTREHQRTADRSQPSTARRGRVTSIQRAAGNQTIQRLHENGDLQAKLAVSQPDDPAELEAERVADEVMRSSEPTVTVDRDEGPFAGGIQRMCSRCRSRHRQGKPLNCEKCEAEIQRSPQGDAPPSIDSTTERDIQSVRGGGRPLPESARSFFESRFDQDFSDVRVHTGRQADEAARSIDAAAFTIGQDIVFRAGNYRPNSPKGKRLLAHELAHVDQQTADGDRSLYRQTDQSRRQPQSLEQTLNSQELSDQELEREIRLIREWLSNRTESGERVRRLETALADLEAEAMERGRELDTGSDGPSLDDVVSDLRSDIERLKSLPRDELRARLASLLDDLRRLPEHPDFRSLPDERRRAIRRQIDDLESILAEVGKKTQQAGGPSSLVIVGAIAISQLDTPAPGPADYLAGILLVSAGGAAVAVSTADVQPLLFQLQRELERIEKTPPVQEPTREDEPEEGPGPDAPPPIPDVDEPEPRRRRGCTIESIGMQSGRYPCHADFAFELSDVRREFRITTPEGLSRDFDAMDHGGRLYEVKTGYQWIPFTSNEKARAKTRERFIDQAEDQQQIADRCGFDLRWYFNEKPAAEYFEPFIRPPVIYQPFDCEKDSDWWW